MKTIMEPLSEGYSFSLYQEIKLFLESRKEIFIDKTDIHELAVLLAKGEKIRSDREGLWLGNHLLVEKGASPYHWNRVLNVFQKAARMR